MAQVGFSKQQLIERMHRDVRLMLAFYLGEHLEHEIPEMHAEIWQEFVVILDTVNDPTFIAEKLQKLLAIPRGHAKTTLIKLAVLLLLRYSKLSFCAYVSNTSSVAYNAILDIVDWIESPKDSELFGPSRVRRKISAENLVEIDLAVPGQTQPKRVILKGFGQGTQIRGTIINNRRPDLLVFDDIESRETVESELMQTRLDQWATGTAMKSMAARGVVIFIGNMIGKTSLLARLSRDKDWNPTVLGAIVKLADGSYASLWPGMFSLESLIVDYRKYVKLGLAHVWEAEMMNLTAEDILGESLDNAAIVSDPTPDMIDSGFLVLDPAFGLDSYHDFSGISVHVRTKSYYDMSGIEIPSKPTLVRVINVKADPEALFEEMLTLTYYWGTGTWAIESVAAQRLLIPLFRTYIAARSLPPGIINLIPVLGGKASKSSRIVAFRAALAAQSYDISEVLDEFKSKLERYTPLATENDDDLDSAAYGPIVWSKAGESISSFAAGHFVIGQLTNNPTLLNSASDTGMATRIP